MDIFIFSYILVIFWSKISKDTGARVYRLAHEKRLAPVLGAIQY
jgi:hypothetical protein